MKTIDSFELVCAQVEQLKQNNVPFERDAVYQFLKDNYFTMDDSPDAIRSMYEQAFPGQNCAITDEEEIQRRQQRSEQMREAYLRYGTERNLIKHPKNCPRPFLTVFRNEVDQESIDFNKRLTEAIEKHDANATYQIFSEHIETLPSYDPEQLLNISDEELKDIFIPLAALATAVQEAQSQIDSGFVDHLSPEAQKRMRNMVKDMDLFSTLKVRCDVMAAPHYAYVDSTTIYADHNNDEKLYGVGEAMSVSTMQFNGKLSNLLLFGHNSYPRQMGICLEGQGFDESKTVFRDTFGKEYPLNPKGFGSSSKTLLFNGEPVVCTEGNKAKFYTLQNGNIVEVNPSTAMAASVAKVTANIAPANEKLTSSTADPLWLLTGSSQYRAMKSTMAQHQKLTQNGLDAADPEALSRNLKDMEKAALDYFTRKKVDVGTLSTFREFRGNHPSAKKMNARELARMEAAYKALDVARQTMGTLSLRDELRQMPDVMQNEEMFNQINNAAPLTFDQRVKNANEQIRNSDFLNAPANASDNSPTAEALRGSIKDSLLNPENGLLNKKFFTVRDRQNIQDVLAKAVVLNIINHGYKVNQPPVAMENAYQENPSEVLKKVKESEAFRNAVDRSITPNGLRDFLNNQSYTAVTKSFMDASMQRNADMEKQNEKQMEMAKENVNEMDAPAVDPMQKGMI